MKMNKLLSHCRKNKTSDKSEQMTEWLFEDWEEKTYFSKYQRRQKKNRKKTSHAFVEWIWNEKYVIFVIQ